MNQIFPPPAPTDDSAAMRERRIAALLSRLPARLRDMVVRLRRPEARLARLAAGVGFCLGGCLFFLPILGIWMLPVGVMLLSDDIPALRRITDRGLGWAERTWPDMFVEKA